MKKKIISLLLATSMLLSTVPTITGFAEEPEEKVRISATAENPIEVLEATATATPSTEPLSTGVFTRRSYTLSVERDYSQYRTIEIKNNSYSDKELYLVCGLVSEDLAIDFIKGGSKSEPILLRAGEKKDVELAIFAQNATNEENEFDIYAYEIGSNGENPTSQAKVYLNVNIPTLNISTSLVSEDSNTLAKTYSVTNNGRNTIADLSVSVDDELKDYAYFDTYIENYSLEPGANVEFTVKPDLKKMKDEELSKLEGNVLITGNGQNRNEHIMFDIDDKEIIADSMHNVLLEQGENPFINMELNQKSFKLNDECYATEDGFNVSLSFDATCGEDQNSVINNTLKMTGNLIYNDSEYSNDYSVNIEENGNITLHVRRIVTSSEYMELYSQFMNTKSTSYATKYLISPVKLMSDNQNNKVLIDVSYTAFSEIMGEISSTFGNLSLIKDLAEIFGTPSDVLEVYSIPNLPQDVKDAYYSLTLLKFISTLLATSAPVLLGLAFPMSLAVSMILAVSSSELDRLQNELRDKINKFAEGQGYDWNNGYKYGFDTEGNQCTNRGSISSDFYVPDFITQPTQQPVTPLPSSTPLIPQLSSPKADLPSGTIQPGTQITLISDDDEGKIYYSLDDGEYTEYAEPITINDSTVLKIRKQDDSIPPQYSNSDIKTYKYAIEGQPFAPEPSPASGVVESGDTVTLTAEEGATIYYAIDDNLEDDEFPEEYIEYTEPIEISKDCKIRTYVSKDGSKDSRVSELSYEVAIHDPSKVNLANNIALSADEVNPVSDNTGVKLYYTGRMFGGGYVNSQTTNYKYSLNGMEVASGTNSGLTEVNIVEIPTNGLKLGKVNNFVRDYDTNPGSHSVSTDNKFTLIYPEDSVISYVGDSSDLPDVRLRQDFAVYNENIYCDNDLIIGQKNKIKINYYNRGSQSGFYTINLYVNDTLADSKEDQFMKYFSSGSTEFEFTPAEHDNNVKVEIINETVDLEEEKSDNNIAEHQFTARDPEIPSIDELMPNTDTEQTELQTLSATITKNRDVDSVVFSVDGKDVTAETKASGTKYWTAVDKLSIGKHTVTLKVTDRFGNSYTKSSEFNIIEPINRYEDYEFYSKQYRVYVKPNTEFNLNDFVGVANEDYSELKELSDYANDITVEYDNESGLKQNTSDKFKFTSDKVGETDITLTLGINEYIVTIYVSDEEIQSCTYNLKFSTSGYMSVDVYQKDEYGWSSFWEFDETHSKDNKSIQVTIYPEDFTKAEDYMVIMRGSGKFIIKGFANGSVDVDDADNVKLSIKENADISDVSCSVYLNLDENTTISAGRITASAKDGSMSMSLAKGKYTIRTSFSYGDEYYSDIEKEIDLTTAKSTEIDLLSLLNYAVVDLSDIKPSDDVEIYAVDESGVNYVNQVKISDTNYNVVFSDDMVENMDKYRLFIVDGNNFYFAPLSKDTIKVSKPETSTLSLTESNNISINNIMIISINGLDYSMPLSYKDGTEIKLPKNKYRIGVQFTADKTKIYKEFDVDMLSGNASIDLNSAAEAINFVVSWNELYNDNGYMTLEEENNNTRSAMNYSNNTGTNLPAGQYLWSLALTQGTMRYSVNNTAEVTENNQTKINVGINFTGKLTERNQTKPYEAGGQIIFRLSDIKDENGNNLNYCSSAQALNAKVVYTSTTNPSEKYDVPLDINSVSTGRDIYATLPEKVGNYNVQLLIEGERVSAPVASVESGTYKNRISVELNSSSQNADIYYTMDGSEPTTESTKYTKAITISKSCVLKAIAVLGDNMSSVVSYEYTITGSSVGNGGGGGFGTTKYTVTIKYVDENGDEIGTSKVSAKTGTTLKVGDLSIPEGYIIDEKSFSHKVTKNETIKVAVKKSSDTITETPAPTTTPSDEQSNFGAIEKPYINGYGNGTFGPNNNITRAEVATLIYNLLGNSQMPSSDALNRFIDISDTHWGRKAIGYNVENGYMSGDAGSSTFRPDAGMTRAELATLLTNLRIKTNGNISASFSDISSHWAKSAIEKMAKCGVISGYKDGTFKPDNTVTRAEAVSMISRLFDRSSDWSGGILFNDVLPSFWAYNTIMNAVNGYEK